jgi:hypothetical protein
MRKNIFSFSVQLLLKKSVYLYMKIYNYNHKKSSVLLNGEWISSEQILLLQGEEHISKPWLYKIRYLHKHLSFKAGDKVSVKVQHNNSTLLRQGIVTSSWRGPAQLSIDSHETMEETELTIQPELTLLEKQKHTCYYHDISFFDLVEKIFHDLGIAPPILPESTYDIHIKAILQYEEDDLNFFHRLLATYGLFYTFTAAGKLPQVAEIYSNTTNSISLMRSLSDLQGSHNALLRWQETTNLKNSIPGIAGLMPNSTKLLETKGEIPQLLHTLKDLTPDLAAKMQKIISQQEHNNILSGESTIYLEPGAILVSSGEWRVFSCVLSWGNQGLPLSFIQASANLDYSPLPEYSEPNIPPYLHIRIRQHYFHTINNEGEYYISYPFPCYPDTNGPCVPMQQDALGPLGGMHFPLGDNTLALLGFMDNDTAKPFIIAALPEKNNPSPVKRKNSHEHILRSKKGQSLIFSDKKESPTIYLQTAKKQLLRLSGDKKNSGILLQAPDKSHIKINEAEHSLTLRSGSTHHTKLDINGKSGKITLEDKENFGLYIERKNEQIKVSIDPKHFIEISPQGLLLQWKDDFLKACEEGIELQSAKNIKIQSKQKITLEAQRIEQKAPKIRLRSDKRIRLAGTKLSFEGDHTYWHSHKAWKQESGKYELYTSDLMKVKSKGLLRFSAADFQQKSQGIMKLKARFIFLN